MSIYVVVVRSDLGNDPEGGGLIPTAFNTFEEAKKEALKLFKEEMGEDDSVADAKESEDSDLTELYIEKGNNIYIHRLKVPSLPAAADAGRRRKTRKTRRSR